MYRKIATASTRRQTFESRSRILIIRHPIRTALPFPEDQSSPPITSRRKGFRIERTCHLQRLERVPHTAIGISKAKWPCSHARCSTKLVVKEKEQMTYARGIHQRLGRMLSNIIAELLSAPGRVRGAAGFPVCDLQAKSLWQSPHLRHVRLHTHR